MKKKWATRCDGKIVKHGQAGVRIGKKGSARWLSYCARSLGISKKFGLDCSGKDKCSPNCLSRRKWKC